MGGNEDAKKKIDGSGQKADVDTTLWRLKTESRARHAFQW